MNLKVLYCLNVASNAPFVPEEEEEEEEDTRSFFLFLSYVFVQLKVWFISSEQTAEMERRKIKVRPV